MVRISICQIRTIVAEWISREYLVEGMLFSWRIYRQQAGYGMTWKASCEGCLHCCVKFTSGNITGRPGIEWSSCFWLPLPFCGLGSFNLLRYDLWGCHRIPWCASGVDKRDCCRDRISCCSCGFAWGLSHVMWTHEFRCGDMSLLLVMCGYMKVFACHEDSWQEC